VNLNEPASLGFKLVFGAAIGVIAVIPMAVFSAVPVSASDLAITAGASFVIALPLSLWGEFDPRSATMIRALFAKLAWLGALPVRTLARLGRRRSAVVRPPLALLGAIARFFCTRRTFDRVFRPVIADIVHEWFEAETAGRRMRSRYLRWVLGPASMINHGLALGTLRLVGRIVRILRGGESEESKRIKPE
jgi:hypothetical protein